MMGTKQGVVALLLFQDLCKPLEVRLHQITMSPVPSLNAPV